MEKVIINGTFLRCRVSEESDKPANGCQFLESGDCEVCNCSECDHGMVLRKDEDGILYSRPCKCRNTAIVRRRLRNAGLLQLAERCTFESFRAETAWQKAMLEIAQAYVRERAWRSGRGLFLAGTSGCGKTHLGVAASTAAVATGAKPQYLRWNTEGFRLKSLVAEPEAYSAALRPFIDADLVLLDDLWKTEPTQGDLRLAFELIDTRLAARRGTIVTSERGLTEIGAALGGAGEAIAGRLAELCGQYLIEIAPGPGRNHRLTL